MTSFLHECLSYVFLSNWLLSKSSIAYFTFERLLYFMNWCNMSIHVNLLWAPVITNVTMEWFLSFMNRCNMFFLNHPFANSCNHICFFFMNVYHMCFFWLCSSWISNSGLKWECFQSIRKRKPHLLLVDHCYHKSERTDAASVRRRSTLTCGIQILQFSLFKAYITKFLRILGVFFSSLN